MAAQDVIDTNKLVLESVRSQISELQPTITRQVEMALIISGLKKIRKHVPATELAIIALLETPPAVAGGAVPEPGLINIVLDIQRENKLLSEFGLVLVKLFSLKDEIKEKLDGWVKLNQVSISGGEIITSNLLEIITRTRQLLSYRPDVAAILDDLEAIKNLKGGPADAVSFHDFHVLQLAFKNVWLHAFDDNLRSGAARLYEETVKLYDEAGVTMPPFDAIEDINQLKDFISKVSTIIGQAVPVSPSKNPTPFFGFDIFDMLKGTPKAVPASVIAPPVPPHVINAYPEVSVVWDKLSAEQRSVIIVQSGIINSAADKETKDNARKIIATLLQLPQGRMGRLQKLVLEIGKALNEPYAFDVFAPDSYNFGLMITYRQKWEPGEYQAGNMVATIPLAPGEVRKFSKKINKKETVSTKMLEKSMLSRSRESSETARAEAEIMQKTTTATNFKMTTHGAFNIGIGELSNTSEFGASQQVDSSAHKKDFREATIKAAEEYKLERSVEIDTSSSWETEEISSGEITNPNNEITVTYLFYELQRRYRIHEFLYRARPVILVAQDVPSPHEIDEAWLVQYQWIIARVLLDDSLRPALEYLTSGFAGDEVSIEVLRAQWQKQASLVEKLESLVSGQLQSRDIQRESIIENTLKKDLVPEMPGALKVFTWGHDPSDAVRDAYDAYAKAGETRLKYTEEALADAQDKLRKATGAFEQATKDYAEAIKNQYTRHVQIDQLRVHVKQNILYYMQAIWSHEVSDQRFFRLYNKKVFCPEIAAGCTPKVSILPGSFAPGSIPLVFDNVCVPGAGGIGGHEHELIEIADIDNPLGYKGNYIIFPLKDDKCQLPVFMLSEFIDNYLGVGDPDVDLNFDAEAFDEQWTVLKNRIRDAGNEEDGGRVKELQAKQDELKERLKKYISAVRQSTDEIIVPTGQLFIEALPGSHALLEDFKLMHRFEDVRKVKAEVRHAELENLRLATRLATGQDQQPELFEDPDIEKKVIVEGNGGVVINE